MKRLIGLIFLCLLHFDFVGGQTISEKEARQILEEAYRCLQTDDTLSFLKLWMPDSSSEKKSQEIISREEIFRSFHFLKRMIDAPLLQDKPIDRVSVQKYDPKYPDTKYNISADFKCYMCDASFGFLVMFFEGKWIVRGPGYAGVLMNK